MWYKQAQNNFGGGLLSPHEMMIQKALQGVGDSVSEPNASIPQSPVQEPTDDYEKRIWDTLVNRTDGTTSDSPLSPDGSLEKSGPAIEAGDARRLSPYHQNPEETTMEEQLEAVRQQNVNQENDQSMSSTEGGRGEQTTRGEYPAVSGKGWNGYTDLPSDKSWA